MAFVILQIGVIIQTKVMFVLLQLGLGLVAALQTFGGTDYLCNASVYSDQCSSVGMELTEVPSQVTSCSASGTCSSCSQALEIPAIVVQVDMAFVVLLVGVIIQTKVMFVLLQLGLGLVVALQILAEQIIYVMRVFIVINVLALGWSYGSPSQVTSCSASGTCSSCSNVGNTRL